MKKPSKKRTVVALGLIIGIIGTSSYLKSKGYGSPRPVDTSQTVWKINNTSNNDIVVTTPFTQQFIPAGQRAVVQKGPKGKISLSAPQTGQEMTAHIHAPEILIAQDVDAGGFFIQPYNNKN